MCLSLTLSSMNVVTMLMITVDFIYLPFHSFFSSPAYFFFSKSTDHFSSAISVITILNILTIIIAAVWRYCKRPESCKSTGV